MSAPRCGYCHRHYCSCGDSDMEGMEQDHRAAQAREEATYIASCHAFGLVPYSSRALEPDEARERMEELEQSRRDIVD